MAGHWSMKDIPSAFTRRVVRFLDWDVGIDPHDKARQSGVDQEYDFFGVVELAIGLELMRFSWPQSEVAEYLKHQRSNLRLALRSSVPGAPGGPLLFGIKPRPYIECLARGTGEGLLFSEPVFTRSPKALLSNLDEFNRGLMVLELEKTVEALKYYLSVAPITRRGRS